MFFFFKQKTAYEMRISDWSSDVCSSDLVAILSDLAVAQGFAARRKTLFSGGIANPTEDRAAEHSAERGEGAPASVPREQGLHQRMRMLVAALEAGGSGQLRHLPHTGTCGRRHVRKECGSTCTSRWSTSPYKQNERKT